MRQPDLRRVALAIELRRLDGSHRHGSTEYDDRTRLHERVFYDQPSPHCKKTDHGKDHDSQTGGEKDAQHAGTAAKNHGGICTLRHWATHAIPCRGSGQSTARKLHYLGYFSKEDVCGQWSLAGRVFSGRPLALG